MALKEKNVGGFACAFLSVQLDPSDLLAGFRDRVMTVCRPEWTASKLKVKEFEGYTNKLLALYQEGEQDERAYVLLRLNGNNTDVFIDREKELTIMLWLHTKGLSPPVYCKLDNGLCYGYVPGRQVKLEELHDPAMGKRVATALARLHTLEVPPSLQQCMLDVFLDGFIRKVPGVFTNGKINESFKRTYGSMEPLIRETKEIKQVLLKLKSPLVFCHNDLLAGNLIYDEKKDTVTFIDFEYGGVNISAFDVGDYFCEFAGLNDDVDFSLYPGEAVQKQFIRDYLTELARLQSRSLESVTEDDVHQFYREANKCALACHIFWCLWALLQAEYSTIDFDFVRYSRVRFDEYMKRKEEFLAL